MHRRSLLLVPGQYRQSIAGPTLAESQLAFWGEWEAPASCMQLEPGGAAQTAFVPLPVTFPNRDGLENTDPFVFDGQFMCSCCKQVWKDGTATYLRDLQRGDVLLFGSCPSKQFLLDTVLVIDRSELYLRGDGPSRFKGKVANSFMEATLKPLARPGLIPQGCAQPTTCTEEQQYRLYWGASPENSVNGMFSFVPARLASIPMAAFQQPNVTRLFPGSVPASFGDRFRGSGTAEQVKKAWVAVAELVVQKGYVLGTALRVPEPRNGNVPG